MIYKYIYWSNTLSLVLLISMYNYYIYTAKSIAFLKMCHIYYIKLSIFNVQ